MSAPPNGGGLLDPADEQVLAAGLPLTLTPNQVAAMLQRTRRWVYERRKDWDRDHDNPNGIPWHLDGRDVRIRTADVLKRLSRLQATDPPSP